MRSDELVYKKDAINSAVQALCAFFGYDENDFEFPITNTDYLVWALRKNITSHINALPPAELEPPRKKGKWIKTGQSFVLPNTFAGYSCSCCGFYIDRGNPLFSVCPGCGADMRGDEDETN